MTELNASFTPLSAPGDIENRWRVLEGKAQTPSFFLRWTWMGSWLGALQAAGIGLPSVLSVTDVDGRDVALALVGQGTSRRKLGAVAACWLHESGNGDGDRPYVEFNGLLCAPDDQAAAQRRFCAAMAGRRDWSALYLSGVTPGTGLIEISGLRRKILMDVAPACFVDLEAVRGAHGEYLSLLGANTRSQIRRSLKDEPADPAIIIANTIEEAELWLADMAVLNAGRHQDNAWDNVFFRDFVRRIVLAGMADGSVEVMRIGVGDEVLGYLITFLWAGRAMNYQSAFAQPRTGKSKPGLMAHKVAVEHYAGRGLALYSFLAGKDRYKQNLSTGAEELHWWVLERANWRLEAEALARRIVRK